MFGTLAPTKYITIETKYIAALLLNVECIYFVTRTETNTTASCNKTESNRNRLILKRSSLHWTVVSERYITLGTVSGTLTENLYNAKTDFKMEFDTLDCSVRWIDHEC